MTQLQEITDLQTRRIGYCLGEPLVLLGHPLTCNGGNDDLASHHDHEVRMKLDTSRPAMVCPECGRVQTLPTQAMPDGWQW